MEITKGNIVESRTSNGKRMLYFVVKVEACSDMERYPTCITICRIAKVKQGPYFTFGKDHRIYWSVKTGRFVPRQITKAYESWEALELTTKR